MFKTAPTLARPVKTPRSWMFTGRRCPSASAGQYAACNRRRVGQWCRDSCRVLDVLTILWTPRGRFTAICRKNARCSHFIVGRDHTGVADFYQDSQTRELFDSLDDLVITPIFFEHFGFNPETSQYNVLSEPNTVAISGTKLRTALLDGDPLPDWYVRDGIQEMLREQMAKNCPVFCESDVEVAIAH